jgi:hypothetical protein
LLETSSRQLKVSRHVILRRMADLRVMRRDVYQQVWDKLTAEEGRPRQGGWALPPPKRCIRENGRLFTSLVLDGRERNLIRYADVADFLSVRPTYLGGVQSALAALAP